MQYILLIYTNEAETQKRTAAEGTQLFQEYMKFTQGIKDTGKFRAGEPLERSSTATTVRVREGKTVRTDGPFAETREQLAGFYIVDATDLDEAVKLAAGIPDARNGSIEVRPIMPMPNR